jgi:hypothetical protein
MAIMIKTAENQKRAEDYMAEDGVTSAPFSAP